MMRQIHLQMVSIGLFLSLILAGIVVTDGHGQLDSQQEMLQLGARLYADNCEACHGEEGTGRVGATLSKNWPSIRPDLAIENTIRSGVEGSVMPAWSRENGGPLTDEEIDALVLFILSWETGGLELISPLPSPTAHPPIAPIPEVEGDPNNGAVLYDRNCAMCHGEDGKGRVGATLDRVWTSIRPDLSVGNTIRNGVEGSVMPAWSRENGGPLTEAEIDDIVAYILTLSGDQTVVFTPQPEPETLPSGWVGIVITVVLLAVIVGLILLLQRRR